MIALTFLAQAQENASGPLDSLNEIGMKTGFDLQHLVSNIIAILIVCAVLQKFAYKPVRSILEERRRAIEESMKNAEQVKKELVDAEAARLSIITKANEQANAIIAEAEKTAMVRAEQRTQEATRQAEDIIKKAHEASVLERDRLLGDLKRQIGALVVQTTEKVAGKVLTSEDQNRLKSETEREIGLSS